MSAYQNVVYIVEFNEEISFESV